MKKEFYIPLLCLLTNIISALIIWFWLKNHTGQPQIIRTEKTIIKTYDSTRKNIPVPQSIPGKPIIIALPTIVDTAEILKDYFSKYPYNRSFGDSNLSVTIIDTTFKNRITASNFSYVWKQPKTITTIKNEILSPLKSAFYAGAFANYSSKTITGFGPELGFDFKQKFIITAGYNIPKKEFNTSVIGRIGGTKK